MYLIVVSLIDGYTYILLAVAKCNLRELIRDKVSYITINCVRNNTNYRKGKNFTRRLIRCTVISSIVTKSVDLLN